MKVTVGLILSHGFPVPAPFIMGLQELLRVVYTGDGNALLPSTSPVDRCRFLYTHAFPTDVARNEVCRLFLDEDDGDYLLFLDADMKPQADMVHRLVKHGLPIVTGRYDMRRPPFHTVAMKRVGDGPRDYQAVSKLVRPQSGLIPIDAAGAGALLIRRDVLTVMRQALGDNWFQYQVGDKGLRDVSEDMWFFERAKDCGFNAFLDADVYSKHIAQFEIEPAFQQQYLAAYDRAQAVSA